MDTQTQMIKVIEKMYIKDEDTWERDEERKKTHPDCAKSASCYSD
jgi:hypothetical protein